MQGPQPTGRGSLTFLSWTQYPGRCHPPEHVLAQLSAHGLHLVLGQPGPLGVEEGAAVLVLRNPVCKMRLEKI